MGTQKAINVLFRNLIILAFLFAMSNTIQGHGATHFNHAASLPLHDVNQFQHMTHNATLQPALSPWMAVLILYGTMFLMLGAQTALFLWKQRHKRSYELVTLIGLWLMPSLFSWHLNFWRFLSVWSLYSCITLYLLYCCTRPQLDVSMPRTVYSWFLGMHRACVVCGVVGYALLIFEVLGAGVMARHGRQPRIGMAMDLLWYGVYFGVLGRDAAEVASMCMVSSLSRRMNLRVNDCGVCGAELGDYSHLGDKDTVTETSVQLSCKHCFHDLCIRGWTIVGKKDMCPVCQEKVDLKSLYVDRPWETRNLTWIQMLDGVRYLVVWNPMIFSVMSLMFHIFTPHPATTPGAATHGQIRTSKHAM
ncbi:hypothetical protein CEUSTIGMA_g6642.t1 [Chlamydomonas eustigma]|uniref:RING-type domain-containing protein n=1 Tax=Chlamydomonas eustigma TaxID=1157962 RepID=A0A250X8I6_9CHLO|nr:hypothetical protein CEUSTIGMA_g6642.t1 [Chlamydomonas eustigma]|eukprot:GAX79202.1 hypothetical protein CEUSTIGMA_g6642.t1 [Chlamydomonas eustigma]